MFVENVLRGRVGAELSNEDREVLKKAISVTREYDARQTVAREGVLQHSSTLLVEGVMCRYVDDRHGVRQLVAVHFPGDFVDLHAYPLKRLDHDVGTLTQSKVAVTPHASLDRILDEHPQLARKLWFLTLLDASMHRAWIFRLGRLKAIARLAHFFCETSARLTAIGASDGRSFSLPLTQLDVGDICGLTSIHVNRVIKELRDMGLCTFRGGRVEIHDLPGLVDLGEFDPSYLYLSPSIAEQFGGHQKR